MELVLAVILGGAFGYILYSIGAGDGDVLINMLRLRQTGLMKTILLGIGIAATLLFASNMLGIVNLDHVSIKALNVGVIVGGALFGIGWGISGYCPGTSVAAAGAGKKDALFYILGGLGGAFLFTLGYSTFNSWGLFENLGDGKMTVAPLTADVPALFDMGSIVGVVIGLIFIAIAWFLPSQIIKKD